MNIDFTWELYGEALKKYKGQEYLLANTQAPVEVGLFHERGDVINVQGVASTFCVVMRKFVYAPASLRVIYVMDLLQDASDGTKLRVVKYSIAGNLAACRIYRDLVESAPPGFHPAGHAEFVAEAAAHFAEYQRNAALADQSLPLLLYFAGGLGLHVRCLSE